MTENIALSLIDDNPYQTRQNYDPKGIEELAADIAARGLLQPPVGRRVSGRVQLVFGHRRKRAVALLAQEHPENPDHQHLPLEIKELSDEDMALCAWSENAKRRDISPVEEASAIRRMMDTFGWTQKETAERLGLSRPAVSNKLRLLRLPDEAREQVGRGKLSERQALALLPVLELSEPAQERIRASWCKGQVQTIIVDPQSHSSAAIRRTVDSVLRQATADLADAVFPLDKAIAEGREGVRSARCDECEFRVRRGKGVLCGDVCCHNVKEQMWCDDYLAQDVRRAPAVRGLGARGPGGAADQPLRRQTGTDTDDHGPAARPLPARPAHRDARPSHRRHQLARHLFPGRLLARTPGCRNIAHPRAT